jgi:Na+-translocating ferredoxin:NAD+ oxidoreductase RNF subunit RnfB
MRLIGGAMPVRVAALAAFVFGVLSATADAQTYGNNTPVCLQVFGRFPRFECEYTSIEQCRPSAAAIAAQCVVNPYYKPVRSTAPRVRYRHHRHAH